MTLKTLRVTTLALNLWWAGRAWGCAGLEAEAPWIAEAPPGVRIQVGYMTLRNRGASEVRLTGADSPDFGRVEFHAIAQGADGMRMSRIPEPVVPPGGSLNFAPGGVHIMLFQPRRDVRAGQEALLILHCGRDDLAVRFVVRAISP